VAPGVWFPFHLARYSIEDWGQENLWLGRVLIQHVTTLDVNKVVVDPEVDDDLFEGPEVPAGTKFYVRSETGVSLGDFEQTKTGRLDLSEEEYIDLLNAANDRERENKRRKQAMDKLIGKPAPEIPTSRWLNGPSQSWDDLKGKVVVLHFWSLWCEPCRPDLERLAQTYASQSNESKAELAIIGVHPAESKPADIKQVMQEYRVKYPVFVDPLPKSRGWGELFNAFEVYAMPQTFVIGADGKIAAHGELEEMLAKAAQLIDEERQRKKKQAAKKN
jgi:thiol-disulfide isomerase/thioredoxin